VTNAAASAAAVAATGEAVASFVAAAALAMHVLVFYSAPFEERMSCQATANVKVCRHLQMCFCQLVSECAAAMKPGVHVLAFGCPLSLSAGWNH